MSDDTPIGEFDDRFVNGDLPARIDDAGLRALGDLARWFGSRGQLLAGARDPAAEDRAR